MTHADGALAIAEGVRAGDRDPRTIVESVLADIAARDPDLNCFRHVMADEARAAAAALETKRRAGLPLGALAGVPFAVKDLFDIAGRPTLAGSRVRASAPPAARDAAAVEALKQADAILVGTLNMDEFAYGFTTENEHYGVTRNPHDRTRVAGGSSGGSAAAVAAGFVPLSLGSDTNGSIRVPAAFCGVFGIKPTFGRLSRDGVASFVASLDHVGAFATTIADLGAAYTVLRGTSRDATVQADAGDRVRVGILDGWFRQTASAGALAAVDRVAAAFPGAVPAQLPEAHRARSAAFCITAAEAGNLHLPDLRARPDLFDRATRDRLMAGALLPAHVVLQSQRFRAWFRAQAASLFERFDLLLAPATPCAAPRIGEAEVEIDGRVLPVRANLGLYTQPISFIGLPVLCVPICSPGALPLGVQLIGAPGREDLLFEVAACLEAKAVVGIR